MLGKACLLVIYAIKWCIHVIGGVTCWVGVVMNLAFCWHPMYWFIIELGGINCGAYRGCSL